MVLGAIGVTMVVIAGSRSPYDTPDSDNYELMYYSVNSLDDLIREPSFVYLSYYLNTFGFGINALFFAYAIMSVPLRLEAICKLSPLPILTLSIYISYFYQLHDLMQMRTAVASSLFLFAIYFRAEKRFWPTLWCILIGFLFHYSALARLPVSLLGFGGHHHLLLQQQGTETLAEDCIGRHRAFGTAVLFLRL